MKLAQGNPGKRTLSDKEPVPPPGKIEPPAWLSARGRQVWDRIAPVATAMKTLTTADVETFARYCQWFAKWIELEQFIRDTLAGNPYFYRRDKDNKITYVGEFPHNAELRSITKILIILEREFGLTAAARTRIQVEMGAGAAAAGEQPAGDSFRDKYLGPIPFRKPA